MSTTASTILITICSLICSGIISTAVSTIVKRSIDKKMDQHLQEQDELLILREEHNKRVREVESAETLQKALSPIDEKLDKISASLENNTAGTVTLLRETMKQTRDQYGAQNYVSSSDCASWHELYNTYKKLGGNHFAEYVDAWKDDVDQLRAKSTKDENR